MGHNWIDFDRKFKVLDVFPQNNRADIEVAFTQGSL